MGDGPDLCLRQKTDENGRFSSLSETKSHMKKDLKFDWKLALKTSPFFALKWSKIALKWTGKAQNHPINHPGYLIKLLECNLAYLSDIDSLLNAFKILLDKISLRP